MLKFYPVMKNNLEVISDMVYTSFIRFCFEFSVQSKWIFNQIEAITNKIKRAISRKYVSWLTALFRFWLQIRSKTFDLSDVALFLSKIHNFFFYICRKIAFYVFFISHILKYSAVVYFINLMSLHNKFVRHQNGEKRKQRVSLLQPGL